MASHRSTYGPGHRRDQVKHHEWRTAENSAEHLIPKLKAMAQKKPKISLLDVGAGSGTITSSLAKYMPEGHLTATDISDEILSQAAQHAESKGVKNISFQKANVFELPFEDASFDITHAHQVLCHLDTPKDAIVEMLRVTKPGGIVALRESDMLMWCFEPEMKPLLQFHDLSVKTLVANGGHDRGGRKLVGWIMSAGVARQDIEASIGTWCYAQNEDREAWGGAMIERLRSGQMRSKAIEMGIATEEEIDAMIEAWQKWMATEDAMLGIMNGQAIITRH